MSHPFSLVFMQACKINWHLIIQGWTLVRSTAELFCVMMRTSHELGIARQLSINQICSNKTFLSVTCSSLCFLSNSLKIRHFYSKIDMVDQALVLIELKFYWGTQRQSDLSQAICSEDEWGEVRREWRGKGALFYGMMGRLLSRYWWKCRCLLCAEETSGAKGLR